MHCETLRAVEAADDISEAARRRLLSVKGEPLFLADWLRAVFIHYEVEAETLKRDVPFDLDLREDKAYVSLVAFTMQGMRPRRGGRIAAWLLKPFATNEYLNVRTYVRHRGEAGIYFLTEWMNNPFSLWLGPVTFGLPYRYGRLQYQHRHETGTLRGTVRENGCQNSLTYEARLSEPAFLSCPDSSLDEFLMERYTAFTAHKGKERFFRIWHPPWKQQRIKVEMSESGILRNVWPWFRNAKYVGGNYSPGARDVWMTRPYRMKAHL